MGRLLDVYRSALGKKVLMAASGIVLFGFVLVHMLGNLKLYQGPEKLNAYAEWLRNFGYPALPHEGMLWIARVVLLGAVALHIVSATQLTILNRRARPQRYSKSDYLVSSYASRTMIWGGVIIALFVVYHLLHLTLGTVHPSFDPKNVYGNVVSAFRVPWIAAFYVVANLALGFHLFHGLWSMFQTLGWANPKNHDWRRTFALVFALIVTAGNVSFPLTVMLRLVS
jgi:succinate dehydrogenase / fumarate reductase cytochrome b subunit